MCLLKNTRKLAVVWYSDFLGFQKRPSFLDWWLCWSLTVSTSQSTSQKWKLYALSCVSARSRTNSSLLRRARVDCKVFGEHYKSLQTYESWRKLMRAVARKRPGAPCWLWLHLSESKGRVPLLKFQSGFDRGVEKHTIRSLREHGNQWILCFLAVTPTRFINWHVKWGWAW